MTPDPIREAAEKTAWENNCGCITRDGWHREHCPDMLNIEAAIQAAVEEAEECCRKRGRRKREHLTGAQLQEMQAKARRDALGEAVRIALSVDEESCLREPKCNALGHDDLCPYVYPVAVIVTRLRAALDATPEPT